MAAEVDEEPLPPLEEEPPPPSFAERNAILIVDDEPAALKLLRTTIEGLPHRYEVLEATDGEAALQLAREKHPRLALVDIILAESGITGVLLCQELCKDFNTRVVVITGKATPKMVDTCLGMGAIAFVPKPFSVPQMRQQIEGWMGD